VSGLIPHFLNRSTARGKVQETRKVLRERSLTRLAAAHYIVSNGTEKTPCASARKPEERASPSASGRH
jgi:hypothetical protein